MRCPLLPLLFLVSAVGLGLGMVTVESLVTSAERRYGLSRMAMAPETVFISHETYTPARGGSASAERATQDWTRSLASWAEKQLVAGRSPLVDQALPEFEKTLIRIAMSQTNGHRQEAARLLGWGRNTLTRKMKALHLD